MWTSTAEENVDLLPVLPNYLLRSIVIPVSQSHDAAKGDQAMFYE